MHLQTTGNYSALSRMRLKRRSSRGSGVERKAEEGIVGCGLTNFDIQISGLILHCAAFISAVYVHGRSHDLGNGNGPA